MKYLYLLLIPVLVFIGCSSDNDDVSINNDNISGHWVSISSHGYTLYKATGEKKIREESEDNSLSLKLYKDGTCSEGKTNGYYKLLGNELDVFLSRYDEFLKKDINWTDNYVIESFSSNKMILSIKNYSVDWDEYCTVYTMKRK